MKFQVGQQKLIKLCFYSFKIKCFFLLISLAGGAASSQNAKCPFQYLYHFGDGFTDIGNSIVMGNVSEQNSSPAASWPYGITTPGRPTGRWSDGLSDLDYAATDFGLPNITPFLSMNASIDYDGVVFSVGGSPILGMKYYKSKGINFPTYATPLWKQISWFKKYLKSVCSTNADCIAARLEKSLVLFGHISGNDIGYPLAQGMSIEEVGDNYVHVVIQKTMHFVQLVIIDQQMVIEMGAKLIIIPGNAPLGCFPYILTALPSNDSTSYDDLGCLKSVNDLIVSKNKDLQLAISGLSVQYPKVTILYGPNGDLALKACCGIGGKYNYNSTRFCGSPGVPVCPYPNQYIFWDGMHFTDLAFARTETRLIAPALVLLNCTSQSSASMSPITDTVATM
ncbi:hypothetical protein BUALT_Bualt10G0054400 [Buddleja alternifolia]|uniref:Uncharacterized protein n=1 Tax=Buddleja alternifolia TaxID=168488 RepID=A0AAV6X4F0_9LAMI|nr:hypothetical protein BUALT_Bualt10G0054400 [Buddleja alternifolia]